MAGKQVLSKEAVSIIIPITDFFREAIPFLFRPA
jgi:hypothetical protein